MAVTVNGAAYGGATANPAGTKYPYKAGTGWTSNGSTANTMTGENAVKWGLGQAQSQVSNMQRPDMPTWDSTKYTNPYADQTQAQGMLGSGYDVAQGQYNSDIGASAQDIRNRYQVGVDQAFQTSTNGLKNTMSNSGMYGSSVMGNQWGDLTQDYAAGSAAAQNQADQVIMANEAARASGYRDAFDLQNSMNKDAWTAGLATNEYNNSQKANSTAWQNGLVDQQYQNDLAQRNDVMAWDQQQLGNMLSLANGGNPMASTTYSTNANTAAQLAAANSAANSANSSALWGAGGSVLGGLLGSDGFWNLFG